MSPNLKLLRQFLNHLATFNRPDGAPLQSKTENLFANQYGTIWIYEIENSSM